MLGRKIGLSLPISRLPEPLQFPTPKEIFLPLAFGQKPLAEVGQKVSIGEMVAESCGGCPAIHSSISGIVTKIEEKNCYYNRKVPTIFIENDGQFSEITNFPTPILVEETKKELLERLDRGGVTDGEGRSLAVDLAVQPGAEALVLCCMDKDPFSITENAIISYENQQVLDGLRLLQRLSRPNQTIIVLVEHQKKAIDQVATWIGRGIRMTIVAGNYPLRHPHLLSQLLDVPQEDTLICTPSSALQCAQVIFQGRPITQTSITVNTPKGATFITAPIGSKISDMFNYIGLYNQQVTVNGGILGTILNDLEISLLPGMDGFSFVSEGKNLEITPCIRCGACAKVCPVGLHPYAQGQANQDYFQSCLCCGACHYVCPAGRLKHLEREVICVG